MDWRQLVEQILEAIDNLKTMLRKQSDQAVSLRDANQQLTMQVAKLDANYTQLKTDSAAQVAKLTANNATILKELAVTAEQKARADAAIAEAQKRSDEFHAQVAEQDRQQEAAIAEFKELSAKQSEQIQGFLNENDEQIAALERIAQALDVKVDHSDTKEFRGNPERFDTSKFST